jgi:hypothetical protein
MDIVMLLAIRLRVALLAVALGSAPVALLSAQTDSSAATSGTAFEFRNPNATRLVFAPTGRMLGKGEGYFSDFWVFFPGVNVGVTDRFSVGAMMSIIPGNSLAEQAYFLTPKFGVIQRPKTNVAVGAMLVGFPGGDGVDEDNAGLLYSVLTKGGEDASITAGLGFGMVSGHFEESPFMMLGGEKRLSNRVALVTENWLMPGGDYGLVSGAVRFMGRDMAVDFGITVPVGEDGGIVIPLLGFVFKW